MPEPTQEQLRRLTRAFPARLQARTAHAARALDMEGYGIQDAHVGDVVVEGEPVVLSMRLGARVLENRLNALTPEAALLVHALMTRHHDGFVRQRHLRHLLRAPRVHTAPFVVQLLGEYVVEIVEEIEAGTRDVDPTPYADFLRENPAFLRLTGDRVVSYWDCYYRGRYPRREDYVGWEVLERMRRWASTPTTINT
jgi:hypothetical protein